MILFEMHFSDSFRFHIFLLSCMSTDYWVVKGVPKNSDRNLAKNLITQRHEKKILKVCLLALIWRFFWTVFFSLNSKFKTLRFSLQFQCLFGHPVVYPENIAWQTRSKTFTKIPIFSRYSLNGQVKAMPVPYIPSDTRVLSTASSSNQILDIGRPDSRYSNRSRDRRSRSRSRHRSRSKHRRANVQSSSSGQSGSTQFSSSNSTGRLVTNGNPRLL